MTDFLITQPCSLFGDDKEAVKKYVTERNASILIGTAFPTNTDVITVRDLIGDPNNSFSEEIAELLFQREVLSREPLLRPSGRQASITLDGKKSLLWFYSWADREFIDLDEPTLAAVAWDLRTCPGFFNVRGFNLETSTDAEEANSQPNIELGEDDEEPDFDDLTEPE